MVYNTVMSTKTKSPLLYVLLGLVPYTKQNLLLSFQPNQFFNELEKTSKYSKEVLRKAYYRAEHRGLVKITDVTIELSLPARQQIQPFVAQKLGNNARLMVIFDIPEERAQLRRQLRAVLRQLDFQQVQQSVWVSDYDHKDLLLEIIEDIQAGEWIQLYEAARLTNQKNQKPADKHKRIM